jgi:D-apiose dehydrogenase
MPPAPNAAASSDSSQEKFRIGVIGTGRISKFHFAAWAAADDVEIVAICDADRVRAETVAKQHGVAKSYGSAAELLDKEKVDAIDIVTPPASHGEILELAAARGIPCLCQKPLARDFDEAQRIVASVTPRIRLMVNENRRHLPYFRQARAWIADGLVGEIQQATMTAFRSSFLPGPDGRYSGTPALVKGRRLYLSEGLLHQVDALRSLLGPLSVVGARMLNTEAGLEGDTLCTILMETPAGAPAVIAGSSVAIGYPDAFNDRFEIFGSRGSIAYDSGLLRLLGPAPREERYDVVAGYDAMYQSCFTVAALAFRDAIRSGAPFPTEAPDNLQTLKIVEDVYAMTGG